MKMQIPDADIKQKKEKTQPNHSTLSFYIKPCFCQYDESQLTWPIQPSQQKKRE